MTIKHMKSAKRWFHTSFSSMSIVVITQVDRSGIRIRADPAGNGIFPPSFLPVPLNFLREPAGKSKEGGSSIPGGNFPYRKQHISSFFSQTEDVRKRKDPVRNNREPPGNRTETRRILPDVPSIVGFY